MSRRPAVTCARRVAPLVAALLLTACQPAAAPPAALTGRSLTVLASWSGLEQAQFERVLADFAYRTGSSVRYIPAEHRVAEELRLRRASGGLPDVAFLPQPGVLRDLASEGRLAPLDPETLEEVRRNYPAVWQDLASFEGVTYGVWFKAANKSLIWYDVATFERVGLVPPARLADLPAVVRVLAAGGVRAFAVAGDDPWTLTDWFENLYLRLAGTARYDQLAAHRIPWTDPSVTATLGLMGELLAPERVAGGLATDFETSVALAFGERAASMVAGGDFVAGVVTSTTGRRIGAEVDVVAFPAGEVTETAVMGGGDVAVLLRATPTGRAFLRYLATPAAAEIWAARGGFLSANTNLDLAVYPDPITRSVARALLDAGNDFRFDLSDLQPPRFDGNAEYGLRRALREFLVSRDVAATAARLEAAAAGAYGAER